MAPLDPELLDMLDAAAMAYAVKFGEPPPLKFFPPSRETLRALREAVATGTPLETGVPDDANS